MCLVDPCIIGIMAATGYNLHSSEGEKWPQNDGHRQVELVVTAEIESVSEGSAVSIADRMALLQIKLKITESELRTERLRSQGNAGATHAMQASSLSAEKDRRLKYTNMLKRMPLDMPAEDALVGSTMSKRHWMPTMFQANGEQASCCPN